MIISHKHKYLFVQTPHTGCTAIGKELIEHYDGEGILFKHAKYHHFLNRTNLNHKEYFVFSSIRHPFDEVISLYFKLLSDHANYSDPKNWTRNGGWLSEHGLKQFMFVHDNKASFEAYLDRYFQLPFVNWTVLDHKKFDYIMRYETLQQDFANVLSKFNIKQLRPIPLVNPTDKNKGFTVPDTSSFKDKILFIFGPIMKYWEYEFDPALNINLRPWIRSMLCFRFNVLLRSIYWRYLDKQ